MNTHISFTGVFLFVLIFSFLQTPAQDVPSQVVPNFQFARFDKTPFTNKNLATGKDLFFIFFDISCDHCQHTIQALNKHIKECDQLAIYLITVDKEISVYRFFNQYGADIIRNKNVVLLQDTKDEFIRKFNPRKYPSVFLYSSKQKLLRYDDEDQSLAGFLKIINTLHKK